VSLNIVSEIMDQVYAVLPLESVVLMSVFSHDFFDV